MNEENRKTGISCPNCGESLEVDSEWIGFEYTCPICGKPFIVTPRSNNDSEGSEQPSNELPTNSETGEANGQQTKHPFRVSRQIRGIILIVVILLLGKSLESCHGRKNRSHQSNPSHARSTLQYSSSRQYTSPRAATVSTTPPEPVTQKPNSSGRTNYRNDEAAKMQQLQALGQFLGVLQAAANAENARRAAEEAATQRFRMEYHRDEYMQQCEACQQYFARDSKVCPHCNHYQPHAPLRRFTPWDYH